MESKIYIVGRKGDIKIEDPSVSSRHIELNVLNDQFYVTDLKSTNGTFLENNGSKTRFKEGYVRPNQVFYLGKYMTSVSNLLKDIKE